MEVYDRNGGIVFERRLMPMIALQRGALDAIGKSLALVWVIWLLVGPHIDQVIHFCNRVRSICTDMGTERKIATMPDIVVEFYQLLLGCKVSVADRGRLFPMALQSPGWQHGWDLVLQRGLRSLVWFPAWLEGFRATIYFFRTKLILNDFCRTLIDRALDGIAEMVGSASVPSIAEWRWGTLYLACKAVKKVLQTLSSYFDASLYRSAKDPKMMQRLAKALASQDWHWQFEFVLWFCAWLCPIASWGKGSLQQEQAKAKGEPYDHMTLGRRLAEAEPHVQCELKRGIDEANTWKEGAFGSGLTPEALAGLQVCVRFSYSIAFKRHDYLSTVPYLLARLLQPGIKQRCLAQYTSMQNHHPVTDYFLSPSGPLRSDVDMLEPDGAGATHRLRQEVHVLGLIPFDDSVAESPHAVGNRVGRHSSSCGFAWVASSMRLDQNLRDVALWVDALGDDLQQVWMRHGSILQTQRHKLSRNMRMKPKDLRDKVYMFGAFCRNQSLPMSGEDVDVADADDGEPHPNRGRSDLDQCIGQQADVDDDVANGHVLDAVSSQEAALMREYLLACLQPGMHVSIPEPDTRW